MYTPHPYKNNLIIAYKNNLRRAEELRRTLEDNLLIS